MTWLELQNKYGYTKAREILRDSREYLPQCNCGWICKKEELKKCPTCGKTMCPECEKQHGHPSALCWRPGRLKIKKLPYSDALEVTDLDTGEVTTSTLKRGGE